MKHLMVILSLLLSGCSPPDYTSTAGVEYRFKGPSWPSDEIEAQEQGFIGSVPRYSREAVLGALAGVQVMVTKDKFRCSVGWCNGQQDYQYLTVRDMGCPGRSALTHEMAHFLQMKLDGSDDYGHLDVALYLVADRQFPGGCK